MKFIATLFILSLFVNQMNAQQQSHNKHPFAIAIHGGAGNISKLNLTPEQDSAYRETIQHALQTGYNILKHGGNSVDAVAKAVMILEDSPLFNAGKGSVFTHDSINEMDAAIMDGSTKDCGAVAGLRTIKNPITCARAVMECSQFNFLAGRGAEEFAQKQGLEIVDTSYFYTPFRWKQLQDAQKEDTVMLDHGDVKGMIDDLHIDKKFGTVGCVAVDQHGNVAAATSTGGITNKRYGRIGDSPVIGAGTYADNKTCAVSCTGKGEDFIKLTVAYDIAALMKYKNLSVTVAADYVINTKLKNFKGRGGCIAIDNKGNIAMPFTTDGMFRGSVDKNGKMKVMIYRDR